MPSFNLIEEPFVPCLCMDGRVTEFGLRDVLVKAHEIDEFRDSSPLVTVSLHRLLLAILHRCYNGPKTAADRVKILKTGMFDERRITAYFEKWKDRFDLFHEKFPFYQRAGFKTAEPSGINRLAQELSRGNNAALFDHTTDDPPPALSPAQVARLVVAEQAFAVGGGKSDTGNTTHAPLVSGAVVLVRGATLFETLWLNLVIYDGTERPVASDEEDRPVWERAPAPPHGEPATPFGYLDFLTWQTRTLCLHPTIENDRLVTRHASYAQGRRCEPGVGFFNPMVGYNRKDAREPFQPVRFNEYRDLWRDSAALYQIRDPEQSLERAPLAVAELSQSSLRSVLSPTARYKFSVFGLCTDKAKVNFWRHDTLPFPLAYLDNPELVESLKRALNLAEKVARALRGATYRAVLQIKRDLTPVSYQDASSALDLTLANERLPKKKPDPVGNRVKSLAPERGYWSRLELRFRELLPRLAEAPDVDGRNRAIGNWFHNDLAPCAREAFGTVVKALSGSHREFHGVAVAENQLNRRLRKLGKSVPKPINSEAEAISDDRP